METIIDSLKRAVKNWWLQLILGVLFIIIGFWTLSTPLSSYLALSVAFSVLMFLSGLGELIFAISNAKTFQGWGWYLAAAIIDFIIGLGLITYPGISVVILPFFVAFWLLIKSFSAIGAAIEFNRYKMNLWWLMLIFGILGIIFTFMIFDNPLIGGFSIVLLTAFAFFSIGIFKVILSFRLKSLQKFLKK